MPFNVAGARQAGYSDPEILAYLSYTSGEPIEDLPGTDDEKIAALLHRRQATAGLTRPGNIDLVAQPRVRNADGSISTVRSMSFGEGGKEILIPTVAHDGSRILSEQEAIDQYHRSGKHLGVFDTPEHAASYAKRLHDEYAQGKYDVSPDEQKIQDLMRRTGKTMLPYEYAGEAPLDRSMRQPAEPPSPALSRPDPSLQIDVPEEAVQPSWMRRFGDLFRGPETMPVSGAPVGAGLGGPTVPDIPEGARSLQELASPQWERKAAGLSTLSRMGGEGAMPLLLPAAAKAPAATIGGLIYGMGAGVGTEHKLREWGVAPGYAALGGDVAGLGGGVV